MTAPSISKLVLELFKTVYARTSLRASAAKSLRRVLFSDIYQANTDFVFWRWKMQRRPMSAFGGKADMLPTPLDVCF
ncbi:MAG: hypothetical protein WBV43_03555 [Pseudolabrys sp.]